jgi:threonine synthase
VYLKLESQNPTGSFKDRGAATLVAALRGLGIERVVEDSSGNAGASLAAYSARAGIECEICVPASSAGPKLAQMAAHGAKVVPVRGKREYVTLAAWAAAAHGTYYASHVYNPYFVAGIETIAYEIWEQLGRHIPSALIAPVGNGTLLLGAYRGFVKLHRAGEIPRLPRLFAVQSAACAPIYNAFDNGQEAIEPVVPGTTAASGITIGHPARGMQILAAVQATGGAVMAVTEPEIEQARGQLNGRGFYVEETSAVAVAALAKLRDKLQPSAEKPWVVPLTGHGLKTV